MSALAVLHRQVTDLVDDAGHAQLGRVRLGIPEADAVLGGGLRRGRLHELRAAGEAHAGAVTGFAAMLAVAWLNHGRPILWLRQQASHARCGQIYAPGYAALGGDPAQLLLVTAPDPLTLLRAGLDAVRCPGLGLVVIDYAGPAHLLTLTASRRLALAARHSGVSLLLLRGDEAATASAADTRWRIRAAPSASNRRDTVAAPVLDLELLRQRSGRAGWSWRVEWDRDTHRFCTPALSRAVLPDAADRPDPADARCAA